MDGRDAIVEADGSGDAVRTLLGRGVQSSRACILDNNADGLGSMRDNVLCSTAYMTSNSDKKKKKVSTKQVGSIDVVPLVDGIDSTIVAHIPIVSSGSHTVVQIVEKSNDGTIPHRKDKTGLHSSMDRGKSIAQKGLRVKKHVTDGKGGLGVVEWVQSAHARIDAFRQHSDGDLGDSTTTMDASHSGLQVSDDEELWEDDHLDHMSNG
ncbi:hypothetical protein V6N13_108319 [Hibiscus sabdariffa]